MKPLIKIIQSSIFLAITTVIFLSCSYAQDSKQEKKDAKSLLVKNLLDSQNYVFVPTSVTPLRGGTKQLTSYYDVTITRDTIVCYLPYFGRAYTATYNMRDNASDFTSTNFVYSKTPGKKGGWEILIKPKDQPGAQQYLFTVYDNGNAFLNVSNVNREPISFQGYITGRKKRK